MASRCGKHSKCLQEPFKPVQPAQQTRLSLQGQGKGHGSGDTKLSSKALTGLGACLGSQEARASLQLMLGTRTQELDRGVHDHHGSSILEERAFEGINT